MKWNISILFLALTSAFLSGCAGDKNAPHPAVQSTSTPAKPKSQETIAIKTELRRSVFTLDQSSRDPFFPQAKKATPALSTSAAAAPIVVTDLPALLTNGLQGIGGTPDRYIAIINNVMLEKGRQTVIPVRVGNQERKFSVKCRDVAKNSVALEVEGYGAMVIKPKQIL
jgi:hypothetical protein